ncbi:DNA repair protein protein [Grosmannia clavigera kw1407]|uniref:L-serine ammonia-lyase n=1 Tax=Grosmannia clavigera (strain kw1407 / UAMH 11150) TaxID=655863 RepID=F0XEB7_GROCL|nr:DNA repair protein [Grosmannia clavigera kw1407]EFX04631.1 DNA repair protein protein [Grosmannia clavigera kw1407]
MAPFYKKTLIVGATSGIGEALVLKLASTGTAVIATGRRRDRLDALVAKAPAGSAAITTIVQDVCDFQAAPAFAAHIAAKHPGLDSVVLNSGIQRAFDFGQPGTVDLAALGTELTTNYLAVVHLVTALLPQLQAQARARDEGADLIFMSATLGLVPSLVRTPNYNASKAALHAFITALRQQQLDVGLERLRVIEVYPPAVQTELHDTVHQPDLVGGDKLGMPLDAFTDELYAKLQTRPTVHVGIGPVESLLAEGGLEDQRQKLFEQQQVHVKKALGHILPGPGNVKTRRTDLLDGSWDHYLASHNISARQIEHDFQTRREAALRQAAEDAERARENGESVDAGFGTPAAAARRRASERIAAVTPSISETPETPGNVELPEAEAEVTGSVSGSGKKLSAQQLKVLDKIKQNKKGKKKKRRALDSDDEDDQTLAALSSMAVPLPGQMENCGSCGKRFTVTPYSRADPSGRLLCTACSKKLDQEDEAARGAKGPKRARGSGQGGAGGRGGVGGGGPVGQRRKTQSRILDGASPVGVKTLLTLCVEHLSRNIDRAEDLGDLPEDLVDRVGRMLSKRRLLSPITLQLLVRPESEEICVYDGAELVTNDYLAILQAMPRLRRLVVYNAIQFKDEALQYLQQRDVRLEALCLYGANLLSETAWKSYLVERGKWLRTLHVCYTDKHVTDDLAAYVRDCAPELQRLKIKGNQAMGPVGVGHLGGLAGLQHLGLDLTASIRADVLVRLLEQVGGSLQTLSLRRADEVDNTVLAALREHCRGLRKLRLTESNRCTDAGFVRLFNGWANEPLRFVDLEGCRFDDPDQPRTNEAGIGLCSDGFRALMAHSGVGLQHVNVCACRHIGREAFEDVFAASKTYPELRHIEVSFCEGVTDQIVCSMFRCCPNLREVVTFGCMRVTGVQVPHGRVVLSDDVPVKPWIETPCLFSAALSRAAGCNVYLKLECLQPSGSFKSRGIGNLMMRASVGDRDTHFYCSSGGNAGLACAVAARVLDAPATIVVPTSTSAYMVDKLRAAGAEVRQRGADWAAADQHLREEVMQEDEEGKNETQKVYVPPFDHPDVWAGAATIVDELSVQLPVGVCPDALICSVGGGGLLCGLMEGIERVYGAQAPTVLAVETAGADSLAASVAAGRLVTLPAITSIATSLGARRVAEQAFAWTQKKQKRTVRDTVNGTVQDTDRETAVVPVVVTDADAVEAIVRLLDDERLLVEPACGAALAPLYAKHGSGVSLLRHHIGDGLTDAAWAVRNVVVVVCGGSNINLSMLEEYRARFGR